MPYKVFPAMGSHTFYNSFVETEDENVLFANKDRSYLGSPAFDKLLDLPRSCPSEVPPADSKPPALTFPLGEDLEKVEWYAREIAKLSDNSRVPLSTDSFVPHSGTYWLGQLAAHRQREDDAVRLGNVTDVDPRLLS